MDSRRVLWYGCRNESGREEASVMPVIQGQFVDCSTEPDGEGCEGVKLNVSIRLELDGSEVFMPLFGDGKFFVSGEDAMAFASEHGYVFRFKPGTYPRSSVAAKLVQITRERLRREAAELVREGDAVAAVELLVEANDPYGKQWAVSS